MFIFSLLSGIELTRIRVGPPSAAYKDDLLTVEKVILHYALAPLVASQASTSAPITVVSPHVTLEMQNGEWNVLALSHAFPPSPPKPPPPPADKSASELPLTIALEHFDVSGFAACIRPRCRRISTACL